MNIDKDRLVNKEEIESFDLVNVKEAMEDYIFLSDCYDLTWEEIVSVCIIGLLLIFKSLVVLVSLSVWF